VTAQNALAQAQGMFDQLVAWRRDFHRHPELGLEEFRTARLVAEALAIWGYEVREGIGKTGVVGLLHNGPGPVVMVRVDMDALLIQEDSDACYASKVPGIMHACGHDAHVAMGLGIAQLMSEARDAWSGTLKMVFQPGEEGRRGAELMIQDGVLDDPRPEAVLALHVWNSRPYGTVGATPGPVMAGAETWEATISGRGGHAAHPEKTVDPLLTAALTVVNLQTIVSRNTGAQQTAVVTAGALQSGEAFNVIPDQAILRGTVRTYDKDVRATVLKRLEEVITGTAHMMGAQAQVEVNMLTPALVNDARMTALVQEVVVDLLGSGALVADERTMGSEDAAYFLQAVPGCYIFVGSGFVGQAERPHHNPHFDFDERAMVNGVAVTIEALRRLMASAGA